MLLRPLRSMPNFNLSDEELQSVVTFLLGLQEHNVPWPKKSFARTAAANGHATLAAGRKCMGRQEW